MISFRGSFAKSLSQEQESLTWASPRGWFPGRGRERPVPQMEALKISAFYRAMDVRSDSIGKFPVCVKNLETRREMAGHYLGPLLWERVNEAMCPFAYQKLVEYQRVVLGNAYVWIYRDGNGRAVELLPLPPGTCHPQVEPDTGKLWYLAQDPKSGQIYKLSPADILHHKGFCVNGITGISLLAHAARILRVAAARDEYEGAVYQNGGHPAGVLQTDADLSRKPDLIQSDGSAVSYRDVIRQEWEHTHAGAGNAFRMAVLDNSLKYQAVSMSNTDAQFVESKAVSVEDIARFTGVPLHKLFAGKQSYSSNEANSLDYVKDTLQPAVTAYEQEDSYKLLTISERRQGKLWLPRNMMAELRGDFATRAAWYETMRNLGAYSVNDILAKEDEADVPGGDTRLASLNYVPLERFAALSENRNKALALTAKPTEREELP